GDRPGDLEPIRPEAPVELARGVADRELLAAHVPGRHGRVDADRSGLGRLWPLAGGRRGQGQSDRDWQENLSGSSGHRAPPLRWIVFGPAWVRRAPETVPGPTPTVEGRGLMSGD